MDAEDELTEEERALLDRIANAIVRRGLTAPAILFLESVRPMNFIASQAMAFFSPMVEVVLPAGEWNTAQRLFERRGSLEALLSRIEQRDAERERER